MFGIVFKLFGLAIALVIVFYAAANAFRNARRLDRRIREFKEEQEELQKQRGPINPYAALAELYTEEAKQENKPPRSPSLSLLGWSLYREPKRKEKKKRR